MKIEIEPVLEPKVLKYLKNPEERKRILSEVVESFLRNVEVNINSDGGVSSDLAFYKFRDRDLKADEIKTFFDFKYTKAVFEAYSKGEVTNRMLAKFVGLTAYQISKCLTLYKTGVFNSKHLLRLEKRLIGANGTIERIKVASHRFNLI